MTAFAAHAVGKLEARAARTGGRGMAAETSRGRCCLAQPEGGGDRLSARRGKGSIGAAVGAAARGRLLPLHKLVLSDDLAVTFSAAMASGTGAACYAFIALRLRGTANKQEECEQQRQPAFRPAARVRPPLHHCPLPPCEQPPAAGPQLLPQRSSLPTPVTGSSTSGCRSSGSGCSIVRT